MVKRKIYLPADIGSESPEKEIKEIRYLMYTRKNSAQVNDQAIQLAMNGNWRKARNIWTSLKGSADCFVLNNLGISQHMTAQNDQALNNLSRAYALCPTNDRVRWKFRSLLNVGARIIPSYNLIQ